MTGPLRGKELAAEVAPASALYGSEAEAPPGAVPGPEEGVVPIAGPGLGQRVARIARIAISLALLAWIGTTLDTERLLHSMAGLGLAACAGAAALLVLQAMLMAWRWHRIVRLIGGELPPRRALQWVFVGLFFNSALPTSVGGDAVKVWLLHRHSAVPGIAFASVAVERLTGVLVLACMILVCLPAPWELLDATVRWALLALAPALLVFLAGVAFADRLPARWTPVLLAGPMSRVAASLRRLAGHPGTVLELLALGVAAALAGIGAAYLIGQALGIDESPAAYIVFVGGAVLLSVLPISLGGWGVREAGMIGLFGTAGVAPELALTLSVAWAGLAVAISLPGGLLWWFTNRATLPPAAQPADKGSIEHLAGSSAPPDRSQHPGADTTAHR